MMPLGIIYIYELLEISKFLVVVMVVEITSKDDHIAQNAVEAIAEEGCISKNADGKEEGEGGE